MKWNQFQNITADNQVRAGGAGAIEAIVSAMKKHKDNAGVCKQGCCALARITYMNGNQMKPLNELKPFPKHHR